ncbi:MAG: DUF3311 domain-containing protein [Marinomonas sp.]
MKPSKPMHPVMMIYFIICTLALIWPGATIANRIDPIILGLPFMIFWYLAWFFICFIGLVICYKTEEGETK